MMSSSVILWVLGQAARLKPRHLTFLESFAPSHFPQEELLVETHQTLTMI